MGRASRRGFLLGGLVLAAAVLLAGFGIFLVLGLFRAQPTPVPRIGFLGNTPGPTVFTDGFGRGLREHGYVEGENIVVEWRFAGVSDEQLDAMAGELVGLQLDVLVCAGTQACLALQRATRTVPIVMGNSSDPVRAGLVDSLAQPGGNITGMTAIGPQLAQKRLATFKELHPRMRRVAVLLNPADPPRLTEYQQIEDAAKVLQLDLLRIDISDPDDFAGAIGRATSWQADALVVLEDPLTHAHINVLVSMIVQSGLPSAHSTKPYVEACGLFSYGADLTETYRQSVKHVDKILRGAKPADLPVEQAYVFELVINLTRVQALGLTIPQSVRAQDPQFVTCPAANARVQTGPGRARPRRPSTRRTIAESLAEEMSHGHPS